MKKIALLAALALAGSAQAAMIDNFNGTGAYNLNAPQINAVGGNASGDLGSLVRTVTATTSGIDTNVQIDTGTNPGVYAHSQTSGVSGASYVEYTLSDVDLTAGFNNSFRVELAATDLVAGIIFVTANDGTNSFRVDIGTNPIIFDAGVVFPAYADFLFSSFTGVDMTSINSLRLGVDGNATTALEVSVDSFQTVCSALTATGGSGANPLNGDCTPHNNTPEPATLGLLGLGLLGLGATRYRKA